MKYLLVIGFVLLGACSSTANISPPATQIPQALLPSDVELAIMSALKGAPKASLESQPETAGLSPGMALANKIVDAVLKSGSARRNPWFYEGRRDGVVFAGFKHRRYYMRVEVNYSNEEIVYSIVDSRNLDQSGNRIHENAFVWLSRLEVSVRENLGKLDQARYELSRP